MNNDLISWYLKEEDPKKGVRRSPLTPTDASTAAVTTTAQPGTAKIGMPDIKGKAIIKEDGFGGNVPTNTETPSEEKEESGTPPVSGSGGSMSNQTPRYNTEAESKLNRELAYNGVLYERMKKYMPLQQKRAGMGNMGIAQTGLAQITNDHMNRRSDILSLYQEEIANASLANSGTDEKTKAAIAAFKDSISSYGSAEEANAGLDALGLEATDPQYIALKTIISGYFRDKADNQTQANIDAFMENLDIHGDVEMAVAEFEKTLSKEDPRFSQYETQIRGHFTNKTSTERRQAADRAYITLYDILSSDATKEEIDKIWNEHAHIIPTMTADQQATLNSLYSVSGIPTKTELTANAESMKYEVGALLDSYATDDEIEAALDEWGQKADSGQLDKEMFEAYKAEILAAIDTEKFDLEQEKTRVANDVDYASEYALLQQAVGAGFKGENAVNEYIESAIAGEEQIPTEYGGTAIITNSEPANIANAKDFTQKELNALPDGSIRYLRGKSLKDTFYIKFNGNWYLYKAGSKVSSTKKANAATIQEPTERTGMGGMGGGIGLGRDTTVILKQ